MSKCEEAREFVGDVEVVEVHKDVSGSLSGSELSEEPYFNALDMDNCLWALEEECEACVASGFPEQKINEEEEDQVIPGRHVEKHLPEETIFDQLGDLTTEKFDKSFLKEASEPPACLTSWKVCHFKHLPVWMQDNDFIQFGHRPPLPSFCACLRSIFRMHTETGNIWTHLLGCVLFVGIAAYFLTRPQAVVSFEDKLAFGAFFAGAILCLGFSCSFHTLLCHSEFVAKIFSKLDYCGIAFLITGSFVPWLYYGFYCRHVFRVIYLSITTFLGLLSVIVSLWNRFGEPKYRPLRAGIFLAFGLSGIIPTFHYTILEGWFDAIYKASLGWMALMGILYVTGALLYAMRIPERYFPGKFDMWLQSHQIFHVLVVAAALVHYHGISEMAIFHFSTGNKCIIPSVITF